MNKKLTEILTKAKQEDRLYIGLMSGTSMDGLDTALCRFSQGDDQVKAEVLLYQTYPFPVELKELLESLLYRQEVNLRQLTILHSRFGDFCGHIVNKFLDECNAKREDVVAIASHGQTVLHAPESYSDQNKKRTATLQMGDADHIAVQCGIPVISDFRQKSTAQGGEGAPLAGYMDFELFRSSEQNRILLNLGGIANLTFIPKSAKNYEDCLVTDTGPANTLVNAAMKVFYQKDFDADGKTADSGKLHPALLSGLHRHTFFQKDAPKSTGPEEFSLNWLQQVIKSLKVDDLFSEDIIATLTRFTAETVANALNKLPESEILVSGGGVHNPVMMIQIHELARKHTFKKSEEYGIQPDAKEALLMAYLADTMLRGGEPSLGRISLP